MSNNIEDKSGEPQQELSEVVAAVRARFDKFFGPGWRSRGPCCQSCGQLTDGPGLNAPGHLAA